MKHRAAASRVTVAPSIVGMATVGQISEICVAISADGVVANPEWQIWVPIDRWYIPARPPNRLWLSGRRGRRGHWGRRTDLKLRPVRVRWAPAIPTPGQLACHESL